MINKESNFSLLDLAFISKRGDEINLINNDYFQVFDVEGMTSFSSSVSSAVVGGMDGDTVNSITAQPRPLTLYLWIKNTVEVEAVKRFIMRYFIPKQEGKLRWTQDGRTLVISGIVDSIDMPRWKNGIVMLVSMHCEQPFWEDIDAVIQSIGDAINLHYFTNDISDMLYFTSAGRPLGEIDIYRQRDIFNDGDIRIGFEISITAIETVTNPIIRSATGEFFGVGYGDGSYKLVMQPGDVLKISTVRRNKTVTLNGKNILQKVKPFSIWLQLEPGDNSFSVSSDDDSISNLYFEMSYKRRYV